MRNDNEWKSGNNSVLRLVMSWLTAFPRDYSIAKETSFLIVSRKVVLLTTMKFERMALQSWPLVHDFNFAPEGLTLENTYSRTFRTLNTIEGYCLAHDLTWNYQNLPFQLDLDFLIEFMLTNVTHLTCNTLSSREPILSYHRGKKAMHVFTWKLGQSHDRWRKLVRERTPHPHPHHHILLSTRGNQHRLVQPGKEQNPALPSHPVDCPLINTLNEVDWPGL